MARRVRAAALPWRCIPVALFLSGLVAVAYLFLRDLPAIAVIEGQSLNWRFQLRGRIEPPPQAVVIVIDDRTIQKLGRWPLPHHELAQAVTRLADARAGAIGLDLLFIDREQPSNGIQLSPGDQDLAAALQAAQGDVLALAFTFAPDAKAEASALQIAGASAFRVVQRRVGERALLRATDLLAPFNPLPTVAELGHVNMPVEPDGTLRFIPAAIALGENEVPAFPIVLARSHLHLDKGDMALHLGGSLMLGNRELRLDRHLRLPIDFYGPAGSIPTFSLVDLHEGRVPDGAIKGHAVLIGATALGLGDSFVTPFSQTMPGVEVLATIVDNLLAGQVFERSRLEPWNFAAILLLGLAAFALARLPIPLAPVGASVLLLAAWGAIGFAAFEQGLWLDMSFPSAAILANAGAVAALRAGIERRMRRNLARYHSPVIADMLAESAIPRFEGRQQHAAVLFVDIRGFTGRSEGMAPDETAGFLREFHSRVERAVLVHRGVLEQFMGDGAMVVFGLPVPGPRDAASALACAHDLVSDIRLWNEELSAAGRAPFGISVGIHYGPVIFARLGGPSQAQMSTAGDTVNVASRLEALTRAHGAVIAISAAVVEAVMAAGRSDLLAGFEQLPTHTVRGRIGRLSIWVSRTTSK